MGYQVPLAPLAESLEGEGATLHSAAKWGTRWGFWNPEVTGSAWVQGRHPKVTSSHLPTGGAGSPGLSRGGEHQRACGQLKTQVIPKVVSGIYHQSLTTSPTRPHCRLRRGARGPRPACSALIDPRRVGKKLPLTTNVENVGDFMWGEKKGPVFSDSLEKSESLVTLSPHSGK